MLNWHGNRGDGLAQVMKGVRMGVREIEGRFGGQLLGKLEELKENNFKIPVPVGVVKGSCRT